MPRDRDHQAVGDRPRAVSRAFTPKATPGSAGVAFAVVHVWYVRNVRQSR